MININLNLFIQSKIRKTLLSIFFFVRINLQIKKSIHDIYSHQIELSRNCVNTKTGNRFVELKKRLKIGYALLQNVILRLQKKKPLGDLKKNNIQ